MQLNTTQHSSAQQEHAVSWPVQPLGMRCSRPSTPSLSDRRSYLQRKGALAAAAAQDLRPRGSPHRIVPPRFFVPLGAPQNALPFQGMPERQVYLGKCFSGATLLERYVEWVAA